eukprot:gb/GFBE01033530.1/.p1 GENE.gb/GFBE01033530.1/~~gb/GFBE01033530.1/.p1  ORF type:complete len:348 (+),score=65.15 gb/GFBE01033530.1/:1-1044(+)
MASIRLLIALVVLHSLQTAWSTPGAASCQVVDGQHHCSDSIRSPSMLQRKQAKNQMVDARRERIIDHMVDNSLRARGFYHHGRSQLLQRGNTSANAQTEGVLDPERIFFFTHHKTGTILALHIAQYMASILGEGETYYWWPPSEGFPCSSTKVANYQNIDAATVSRLQQECPGFRAVHFLREAGALTTSAYLYHSTPGNSDSVPGAGDDYYTLASKSLEEGLQVEAQAQNEFTLQDMLEVRNMTKDLPNVMRVGLEEFGQDFDGMTRKMFEFLLGPDHPKISEMVAASAVEDTSRWSESDIEATNHVADKAKTEATLDALFSLRNSSTVVTKTFSFDEPLGYDIPSL